MEGNIKNTLKKWLNKKIQDWKKTQEQQNWEDVQTTVKTIIDCFTEDQLKDLYIKTKNGEIISLKEILLAKYKGTFPSFQKTLTQMEANITINEFLALDKKTSIPAIFWFLDSFEKFFTLKGDPKNLVRREILKRNFYKCINAIIVFKKLLPLPN